MVFSDIIFHDVDYSRVALTLYDGIKYYLLKFQTGFGKELVCDYNVNVTKEYISEIQKRVIFLLRSHKKNAKISLPLLVKDVCSEVSRLVACWILSADSKTETMIAKGKDVLGRRNFCHDVLLVVKDNVILIIDPTIWQIYPKKKSIYVGKTHSVDTALEVLKKKYDGLWKISETVTLTNYPKNEQAKLQKSIL